MYNMDNLVKDINFYFSTEKKMAPPRGKLKPNDIKVRVLNDGEQRMFNGLQRLTYEIATLRNRAIFESDDNEVKRLEYTANVTQSLHNIASAIFWHIVRSNSENGFEHTAGIREGYTLVWEKDEDNSQPRVMAIGIPPEIGRAIIQKISDTHPEEPKQN